MTNKEKKAELRAYIAELINEYGFVSEQNSIILKGRLKTFTIAGVKFYRELLSIYGRWNDGKKFNLCIDVRKDIAESYSDIENYFALIDLKANNVTGIHDGLLYPEGIANEMEYNKDIGVKVK